MSRVLASVLSCRRRCGPRPSAGSVWPGWRCPRAMVAENSRVRRSALAPGVQNAAPDLRGSPCPASRRPRPGRPTFSSRQVQIARRARCGRFRRPGVPTTMWTPCARACCSRRGIEPADARGDPRAGVGVQPQELAVHLLGELAGRRDHERERRPGLAEPLRVSEQRLRDPDPERDRLAGARLRRHEQITALCLGRDHRRLDRRRRGVAAPSERSLETGRNCRERHEQPPGATRKGRTLVGLCPRGNSPLEPGSLAGLARRRIRPASARTAAGPGRRSRSRSCPRSGSGGRRGR